MPARPSPGDSTLPDAVVAALRCPVCSARVGLTERVLRCERRHAFDLSRQGYVNLLPAKTPKGTADTVEMVAARETFLRNGFYAPLVRALTERAHGRLLIDAGAGTGHYLAALLNTLPEATGLALDVSAPALRRAARAHARLGAAVCNLWQPWPVGAGVADLVVNVFAPRNAAEFHRVLAPGGRLLVAGPGSRHLRELSESLPLLDVGADKTDQLDSTLAGGFVLAERANVTGRITLSPDEVRLVVLMGPNAHHVHRDGLGDRLAAVSEPVEVTTSFTVSLYDRRE